MKYYLRLRKILDIIESGQWRKYKTISALTIAQVDKMRIKAKAIEDTLQEFQQYTPIRAD